MIQEYLVYDADEKEKIIAFDFNQKEEIKDQLKIQKSVIQIDDANVWVLSYSIKSNSEEAAKILSDVDKWICQNAKVTILTNESSAYFNKILFPIINDFERNLRKLLYLMSAKHRNEDSSKNIKDLEDQDLGKIFELLFADTEFNQKVKQLIKNKSWNFTKSEIISDVNDIDEVTVWDRLVGKDIVPSLRNEFIKVKDYRNHVMHAHNIDYKTYNDIKKLYKKVNTEIDDAIGRVMGKRSVVTPDYNTSLREALSAFAKALEASDIIKSVDVTMIPTMKLFTENIGAISPVLDSEKLRVALDQFYHNTSKLSLNTHVEREDGNEDKEEKR